MQLVISEDQKRWLEANSDGLRNKSAIVRDLIDSARLGLDRGFTLGKPSDATADTPRGSEGFTSSSNTSNKKTITNKRINTPIQQHEELIREFWKGKGGAKSDTAWKLLMTELEKLQAAHGDAVVKEQLQLAINGKWKGVSAARYEQFKPKHKPWEQEQPNNHPASRVYTAADFDMPAATNPALSDLF